MHHQRIKKAKKLWLCPLHFSGQVENSQLSFDLKTALHPPKKAKNASHEKKKLLALFSAEIVINKGVQKTFIGGFK